MNPIDAYLARLGDPAIRASNRRLNGFDEGDPGPGPAGVEERHVAAAEAALGVALPPSYRKLVLAVAPADAEYGIYWVLGDDPHLCGEDIVSANRDPESPLPPFLVAVQGTDGGDVYCLDTRRPDDRGEYPVVLFDHEADDEDGAGFEPVARDLGAFLLGSLPEG